MTLTEAFAALGPEGEPSLRFDPRPSPGQPRRSLQGVAEVDGERVEVTITPRFGEASLARISLRFPHVRVGRMLDDEEACLWTTQPLFERLVARHPEAIPDRSEMSRDHAPNPEVSRSWHLTFGDGARITAASRWMNYPPGTECARVVVYQAPSS